jgi:ADP-ribosylglycohydrolase
MNDVCSEVYPGGSMAESVRRGLESAGMETEQAVLEFGQSCDQRGAVPSVVHLVARHEADLKEALVQNVMAGGDSAARGLLVGMLLGAHLGLESIPPEWLASLKKRDHILELLEGTRR